MLRLIENMVQVAETKAKGSVYNVIYIYFTLAFMFILINSIWNIDILVEKSVGTTLNKTLRVDNPLQLIVAYSVNLALSIPIILDALLDSFYHKDISFGYQKERIIIFLISFIPDLAMLISTGLPYLPIVFVVSHSFQCCGCYLLSMLLCHKIFPKQFPLLWILIASLSWITAFIFGIYDFCNVTMIPQFLAIIPSFIMLYLTIKLVIDKDYSNSIKEGGIRQAIKWSLPFVNFLLSFIVTVVVLRSKNGWLSCDLTSCLLYLYSSCIFSLIVNNIPCRIAKLVVESDQDIIKFRKAILRYLSHEIRSPLNVANAEVDECLEKLNAKTIDRTKFSSPKSPGMMTPKKDKEEQERLKEKGGDNRKEEQEHLKEKGEDNKKEAQADFLSSTTISYETRNQLQESLENI
jgi:hypothetical protein